MTRVSISEAGRRLPQLVRQVKQDRGWIVQITVRDEVVSAPRVGAPASEAAAAGSPDGWSGLDHEIRIFSSRRQSPHRSSFH
jgi:antitoxin (DNA-binding transcriptional repressor) of toxin-antitoxin stability system